MNTIASFPTGTVTFLFTDIQGSTPLWERAPEKMAEDLQIHNHALRQAIQANGGVIFKIVGDAFQAAFATAPQALKAAIQGQQALLSAQWNELGPLKVRMGLHTGEAELDPSGDEYAVSHAKNRVARIMSAGHGGQILLSQETADLVQRVLPKGVTLKDLGDHRLKGMEWSERLYQVCAPGLPQEFPSLSTAVIHPNNLPVQLTSFIGREAQVSKVKDLLKQYALVTLTGSGGVGKTRLSLQVAWELVEQFQDGVWFVELAPVTVSDQVPQAVASTLRLKSVGSQPIQEILREYLHNRQVLLVLDNCEHLIEACATLTEELLRLCQRVKILASSREALGVAGEMHFRVPSLTLPDPAQLPDTIALESYEAVRLFSERARLTRPDFQVTAHNAPAVAQICQRLDGIPLAIELAAARLAVLTSEQLLQHLRHAFRVLTGGSRTALPRQQTLRAAIDWSYRLLSEEEKKLLRRLAVFVGSFDLPAVEAVCCLEQAEKFETLDSLTSLANKSMLIVEHQTSLEMRYRLLETVRQYAREKLDDSGESERLHDLHAAYYLDLAQQGGRNTFSRHAPLWLRRMDEDLSNIRAAFDWALEGEALDEAIQALLALRYYWLLRSNLEEGRILLERALNRTPSEQPSFARAGLLRDLGLVESLQGVGAKSLEYCVASRELFRDLGNRSEYAWSTLILGYLEGVKAGYFTESAAIFKELGDEESLAFTLWLWGFHSRDAGDLDQAERLLRESERLYRKLGSWKLGDVYFNLASVYFLKGQPHLAHNLVTQALPLLQEVNDQWGMMWCKLLMVDMQLAEAADDASLRSAEAILLEILETAQKIGNKFWVNFQIPVKLARIALSLGEYTRAMGWLRGVLNLVQDSGSKSHADHLSDIGQCILGLAEAAACMDNPSYSARLLGALEGLRESDPNVWDRLAPPDYERLIQAVRGALGEDEFIPAYTVGKGLTLEQAVALALEVQHE